MTLAQDCGWGPLSPSGCRLSLSIDHSTRSLGFRTHYYIQGAKEKWCDHATTRLNLLHVEIGIKWDFPSTTFKEGHLHIRYFPWATSRMGQTFYPVRWTRLPPLFLLIKLLQKYFDWLNMNPGPGRSYRRSLKVLYGTGLQRILNMQ